MGRNRCLDDLNILIGFKSSEVNFKARSLFSMVRCKTCRLAQMSLGRLRSAGNEADRLHLSGVLAAGGESRSALSTDGNHNILTVQRIEE